MNNDLSSSTRDENTPKWRYYLYYLFNALRKIPIWRVNQDLYRGVRLNLVKKYPNKYQEGNEIIWFGVTSTTTNLKAVKSFIGNEEGTIFSINSCLSGRDVHKFSGHEDEAEVLVPPGSRFKIMGIIESQVMTIIQLKQIPTLEKLLKLEDQ